MPQNNFSNHISKKAYEIAYALFRTAQVVKRESFSRRLEDRGLELLVSAVEENYVQSRIVSRSIRYLLRFGEDLGIISAANSSLITKELDVFNAAIAELEKSAKPDEVNLNNIFSKAAPVFRGEVSVETSSGGRGISGIEPLQNNNGGSNGNGNGSGIVKVVPHSLIRQPVQAMAVSNVYNQAINPNGSSRNGKSEGRQATILERIRQNNNCRLKDVQEALPEASERTLRYDLQNLLGQGLIERSGNGGPATFYSAKE